MCSSDLQAALAAYERALADAPDAREVLMGKAEALFALGGESRLAEAMGIRGYLIQTPQDVMNLNIPAICMQKSPTLLDIRIDAAEIPPIGRRIQALQSM